MRELLVNPGLDRARTYDDELRAVLSLDRAAAAHAVISRWSGYAPTPLRDLTAIAKETGVASALYKDEGGRFGLGSFKALGGAYAVDRLVEARGGAQGLVVTCATDGNHGRAVAWGARRAGARAVIYVHEGVSEGRADAIRSYGADVVREGDNYDASIRASTQAAGREGWTIVSDTSWPGYDMIPRDVMQGYAMLALEARAQGADPTHVFVQGGVGGVAAAVLSWFWEAQGAARPRFIVVEPDKADCLLRSARAGRPTNAPGDLDTVMAGLACGEPSLLAWKLLGPGADAFMSVTDADAIDAMRVLAKHGVVGGESGVAGLAGFLAVAGNDAWRRAIGLDASSRVLLIGTEGATDPQLYARLVGRSAEAVEMGEMR